MIHSRQFPQNNLAPGDQRSLSFDFAGLEIREVFSAEDPDFEIFYRALDAEFGARGEMETREVLHQRLAWKNSAVRSGYHLDYKMLAVFQGNEIAAVRDHSLILAKNDSPGVCVHLSHVLVSPAWRRTGLAGWMRAFPVQDARRFSAGLGLPPETPITLVAEMEPLDSPDQLPRLKAYARAGFRRVDPLLVSYRQPDFRSFSEIDANGGPLPLPFWLMVRLLDREDLPFLSGKELRTLVGSLYAMYSEAFRPQDMMPLYADLENLPAATSLVPLEDISSLP